MRKPVLFSNFEATNVNRPAQSIFSRFKTPLAIASTVAALGLSAAAARGRLRCGFPRRLGVIPRRRPRVLWGGRIFGGCPLERALILLPTPSRMMALEMPLMLSPKPRQEWVGRPACKWVVWPTPTRALGSISHSLTRRTRVGILKASPEPTHSRPPTPSRARASRSPVTVQNWPGPMDSKPSFIMATQIRHLWRRRSALRHPAEPPLPAT